jgi:hypothetical protein
MHDVLATASTPPWAQGVTSVASCTQCTGSASFPPCDLSFCCSSSCGCSVASLWHAGTRRCLYAWHDYSLECHSMQAGNKQPLRCSLRHGHCVHGVQCGAGAHWWRLCLRRSFCFQHGGTGVVSCCCCCCCIMQAASLRPQSAASYCHMDSAV